MHDIAVLITDTQEKIKLHRLVVVAVRLASTLLKKDEHVHSS
jgi:hypothetical protein